MPMPALPASAPRLTLIVAAILLVSLGLAAVLGPALAQFAWLPLGLAVAALGIALLALVRLRLLEFAPEVLAGDVILPRASRLAGDVKLLLPLQFINAGNADGIIEWVALRLTVDGHADRSVLLSPVAEVDMQRFIQAKRKLDTENTIEPFTAFALEGRRSLAKFVLFDVAERPRAQALQLRPGRYAFELFVKSSATRQPKLERTFEHSLEQKQIEEFRNDSTVYLINYQINLPAARRELASVEWLPGAARRAS
ncbi:MAG: hypothetical protein K0S03_648 [Burkholderiales bacterium]|nr:hypothetical protein [Burkholderiales bacterium]